MTGLTTGVLAATQGFGYSLVLKADGSVWATGYNGDGELGIGSTVNQTKPVKIAALSNVIAISSVLRA